MAQNYCWHHGEQSPPSHMTPYLGNGFAGVIRGVNADPISGPIRDVITFLAHLHEEGYQHRSLNAYRSAFALVHTRVDGYSEGEHPLVTRVLRGSIQPTPTLTTLRVDVECSSSYRVP